MHLGDDNWVIWDSCIDNKKQPVSLRYLGQLGTDVASAVKLLVVTHWHDDHIRGMSEVARHCISAPIALPQSLLSDEFGELVEVFESARLGSFTSGFSEIRDVMYTAVQGSRIKWAIEGRVLWTKDGSKLSHGQTVKLQALSPCDNQVSLMLQRLARDMPKHSTTMYRIPSSGRNDVSVATWANVGATAVLLGADVETTYDSSKGWDAIISSRTGEIATASLFKIPHHGSQNGHHPEVWTKLLDENPVCVLTPWQLGGGLLPTHDDIERLLNFTSQLFTTNPGTLLKAKKRHPAVERTLKEGGYELRSVEGRMGQVRLRARPGENWRVEMSSSAAKL